MRTNDINKLYFPARSKAYLLILVQTILVGCAALIALFIHGWQAAYSTALGGFISIIPNGLFAFFLFTDTRARAAKQIMLRFFLGEIGKLFLNGFLFVLVIKYANVSTLMVVIGFVVATVGFMFTPLLV